MVALWSDGIGSLSQCAGGGEDDIPFARSVTSPDESRDARKGSAESRSRDSAGVPSAPLRGDLGPSRASVASESQAPVRCQRKVSGFRAKRGKASAHPVWWDEASASELRPGGSRTVDRLWTSSETFGPSQNKQEVYDFRAAKARSERNEPTRLGKEARQKTKFAST